MGVLDWLYWPVDVIHNWVLCKIPGISKITPDWFFFKDSPSKWEIPYFHHVIDPIFGPPVGQRRKVKDELKNMMDKYVQIGGNRDAMRTISDEIRKNKTFSKIGSGGVRLCLAERSGMIKCGQTCATIKTLQAMELAISLRACINRQGVTLLVKDIENMMDYRNVRSSGKYTMHRTLRWRMYTDGLNHFHQPA